MSGQPGARPDGHGGRVSYAVMFDPKDPEFFDITIKGQKSDGSIFSYKRDRKHYPTICRDGFASPSTAVEAINDIVRPYSDRDKALKDYYIRGSNGAHYDATGKAMSVPLQRKY